MSVHESSLVESIFDCFWKWCKVDELNILDP